MVHAADAIALDAALGQLRPAVRAAIVQRDDLAALAAVEHDRLAEDPPLEQLAVHDLMVPAAHVPAILEEHRTSPVAAARLMAGRMPVRTTPFTPITGADLAGISGKIVHSDEQWTGT